MDNTIFLAKLLIGVAISVILWGIVELLIQMMKIHDHRQRSYLYFITLLSSFSSIMYAFIFIGIDKNGDELIVAFPHSVLRFLNMILRSVTAGERFAFFDLGVVFFSLTIVSVLIFVVTVFFSSFYVKKRFTLEKCENRKIVDLAKRICHNNNVNPPEVMMIDGINAFVFGVPPILAIGKDLVENVNEKELELIIRHEMNHIRNCDNILKPFLFSLRILFFFNPVVHILSRKLTGEREFLADIVSEMKKERVQFLYSLLRLNELHLGKKTMVPSIISFSLVRPNLKARTEALLRENKKRGMRPYFISLWVFALLIIVGMYVSSAIAAPGKALPPGTVPHEPERIFDGSHPPDILNADHQGIHPMGRDAEFVLFRSQGDYRFVPDPRAFVKNVPGEFYCVNTRTAIAFILMIPLLFEGGYCGIRMNHKIRIL